MRSGVGLMGEAGPEAILPLQRGADGRLGVAAASGGPAVNIVFNVTATDAPSFAKSETQITGMLARAVAREGSGFSQMATVPLSGAIGELLGSIWPGFEGRLDRAGEIWVRLYGGELAAVSDAQLLNGANLAAVGSMQTGWELIQFADAEEMEPSIWRLRGLLRGLWGTDAAMRSGAQAAADFVLLDGAVVSAGLVAEQGGLALNWRIGPSGYELSDERFASFTLAGGLRAQMPLSPVHLRARPTGGGLRLEWIRRGRIGADAWMGEEIPLGEETELYVIEIAEADGPVRRTATVVEPHWTYPAELMTDDFATPPDLIDVAVRQVSATVGPGTAATRRFALDGIT